MNVRATQFASLMDLDWDALQLQLAVWKQPGFRVKQVWEWLYVHLATDLEHMSNLPKPLRQQLAQSYLLDPLTRIDELVSHDRLSRKVLFRLPDGETIESVLMRYDQRNTVCVSAQVGCPIGCSFCATGQSGFSRNLSAGEIVAQPLYFARELGEQGQEITNIVIMGMGEPLLNYDAVWQAIKTWNDHRGFDIGARRITLSTAGYVPGIDRLAQENLQVGLAISLHAPDDGLRDQLVPLNKAYPLADLIRACHRYVEQTGRRITVEYALIDGINDSITQARQLAALLHKLICQVNLIPLNPSPGCAYHPSSPERARAFEQAMVENGVSTTVRLRRGLDIQAGCGQLRRRHTGREA